MNSQGHRGEKLKACCYDSLALTQPSTSARQHISVVKGVDNVSTWGWVRECQRKDQTLCVHMCILYVCVCLCVCLSAGLASRCESPPVAMFYSVSCCRHACHSLSEPAHSNSFKGYCRLHTHCQLLHYGYTHTQTHTVLQGDPKDSLCESVEGHCFCWACCFYDFIFWPLGGSRTSWKQHVTYHYLINVLNPTC